MVFLAVVPLVADIVPISLSQQVGGSGDIGFCEPEQGCIDAVPASFNYSYSNNQPGPYSVSQTGQATGTAGYDGGRTATAETDTEQTSDETVSSISLDMDSVSQINAGQVITLADGDADGANEYSFEFNLTYESTVHLVGMLQYFATVPYYGSASSDAEFLLTGPGFQLDSSSLALFNAFDLTFTLDPGIYTLTAFADTNEDLTYVLGDVNNTSTEADLSLTADFTEVPEPTWTPIAPSLLLVLGACVFSKLRAPYR